MGKQLCVLIADNETEQYSIISEYVRKNWGNIDTLFSVDSIDLLNQLADSLTLPSLIILYHELSPFRINSILEWLQERPQYQAIPVIIFTANPDDEQIQQAYSQGVRAVLQKPVSESQLAEVMEHIRYFWLRAGFYLILPGISAILTR